MTQMPALDRPCRGKAERCTGKSSISRLLPSMCNEILCPRTSPVTAEHKQLPDCALPSPDVPNYNEACLWCPFCKLAQAST